jgi:transposase
MVLPGQQSFAVRNDAAGWAELVAQLGGLAIAAIGLEASGGYEPGRCAPCWQPACRRARSTRSSCASSPAPAGFWPRTIRSYAHDRVVCRHHADTSGAAAPARDRTAGRDAGGSPSAQRRESAVENAARLLEDAMLQRLSRRRIARLAADIDMLDRHLAAIVESDAALAHRYQLLTSMPGVGLVLACALMALLPELGTMSRKQVAALVGVAPYAFESGKFKGRRCIWGGRTPVREVLYMAAMSAGT